MNQLMKFSRIFMGLSHVPKFAGQSLTNHLPLLAPCSSAFHTNSTLLVRKGKQHKEKSEFRTVSNHDHVKKVSWEVSAAYLQSEAYKETYKGEPVWKSYKRIIIRKPVRKTRDACIVDGRHIRGSPCPICRDDHLVIDYRNTELVKQFIDPHSESMYRNKVTNLCQETYFLMRVAIERAYMHGYIEFTVPHRHYDYRLYPEYVEYKKRLKEIESSAT